MEGKTTRIQAYRSPEVLKVELVGAAWPRMLPLSAIANQIPYQIPFWGSQLPAEADGPWKRAEARDFMKETSMMRWHLFRYHGRAA